MNMQAKRGLIKTIILEKDTLMCSHASLGEGIALVVKSTVFDIPIVTQPNTLRTQKVTMMFETLRPEN